MNNEALLATTDSSEVYGQNTEELIKNESLTEKLAKNAYQKVIKHAYKERCKNFFEKGKDLILLNYIFAITKIGSFPLILIFINPAFLNQLITVLTVFGLSYCGVNLSKTCNKLK